MDTHSPIDASPIADASATVNPARHTPHPPGASQPLRSGLVGLAVVTSLIVGGLAWAVGEATYDLFQPSKKAASEPYAFKQLNLEKNRADGLNGALAFGALGGLVGLAMGSLGGFAVHNPRAALRAGAIGLVLGLIAGAAPSPLVVPFYNKYYEPHNPDLKLPVFIHGTIWCAIGAAAGLAFGLGLGDKRRIGQLVIAGILGAFAATLVFDLVAAIAFPFSEADVPISPSLPARLMARLLVPLGISLGLVIAARR